MRAAFAAVMLALIAAAPAAAEPKLLHQERSLYRNIFVTQDGDERCMLFRWPVPNGRESCVQLHNPDTLIFDYTKMMLSVLYLEPNPKRILIVGEGGGTLPTAMQKLVPDARIDVVELDEAVDRTARQYFGFKPGANTTVTISDGRVYVKRVAAQKPAYDIVMLDAFENEYIPEHMLTQEFEQEVKAIMAPHGVIAANTFSSSELYDHESATYHSVFGPFFNLKLANRVVLGRNGGLLPTDAATAKANAALWEPQFAALDDGKDFILPLLRTEVDWDPNARLLTDQYSPSNLLNAIPRKAR